MNSTPEQEKPKRILSGKQIVHLTHSFLFSLGVTLATRLVPDSVLVNNIVIGYRLGITALNALAGLYNTAEVAKCNSIKQLSYTGYIDSLQILRNNNKKIVNTSIRNDSKVRRKSNTKFPEKEREEVDDYLFHRDQNAIKSLAVATISELLSLISL